MKLKTPLYHKVYDYLLEKIKKEYKPGDLLPTQSEIADITNTSLITVKRAIKELETSGYVESRAGKGTSVKKPKIIDNHVGVSSWTDSISAQGSVPNTGWTRIEKQEPSSYTADILKLKAREKVIVIERLRIVNKKPICIMTNKIPARLVPNLNKETKLKESFYTHLRENYGLVGASASEEVTARTASEYEIETLQLKTPIVLVIDRVSYLLDNVPFERSSVIASADSYIYRSQQINRTLDSEDLKKVLISTK